MHKGEPVVMFWCPEASYKVLEVLADDVGVEEGVGDELGAHLGSHRPPRG